MEIDKKYIYIYIYEERFKNVFKKYNTFVIFTRYVQFRNSFAYISLILSSWQIIYIGFKIPKNILRQRLGSWDRSSRFSRSCE